MKSHKSRCISKNTTHTNNLMKFTKKKKKKTTEQIIEGLKTCLFSCEDFPKPEGDSLHLKRAILINQTDEDKKNLQTMIKVFITSEDLNCLNDALQYTISDLELPCINSVILSYQHKTNETQNILEKLLFMWKTLEDLVVQGLITSIGISDVDTDVFINLYNAVEVKPSIHQINLSACCVVPPDLQEFCKEHDIRILTHNDPFDILPVNILKPLFQVNNEKNEADETKRFSNINVAWVTRFQAHIKCRGILSNKGYIVRLNLR
ncbi:hypothetical protein PGB90_008665 [Kerria lacca]